jgi:hypothetical protein
MLHRRRPAAEEEEEKEEAAAAAWPLLLMLPEVAAAADTAAAAAAAALRLGLKEMANSLSPLQLRPLTCLTTVRHRKGCSTVKSMGSLHLQMGQALRR